VASVDPTDARNDIVGCVVDPTEARNMEGFVSVH
jgi:hypothetical protein